MFEPGWYHTGLSSWLNPEIEYFANGPGYDDRRFDHGPFKNFSDAKADFYCLLIEQKEVIRETVDRVKKIRKQITFKQLSG